MYFSLHGNGGLFVNCVLYQDGQGKGHENPKMVIILRGGAGNGGLNTSVQPLLLFSDCKIKSRLLPEQSKAVIWNGGNLELKNKLECKRCQFFRQAQAGESPNTDHTHTLKFYNSIKLSQYVYKKQYYPETLSICTNG